MKVTLFGHIILALTLIGILLVLLANSFFIKLLSLLISLPLLSFFMYGKGFRDGVSDVLINFNEYMEIIKNKKDHTNE